MYAYAHTHTHTHSRRSTDSTLHHISRSTIIIHLMVIEETTTRPPPNQPPCLSRTGHLHLIRTIGCPLRPRVSLSSIQLAFSLRNVATADSFRDFRRFVAIHYTPNRQKERSGERSVSRQMFRWISVPGVRRTIDDAVVTRVSSLRGQSRVNERIHR